MEDLEGRFYEYLRRVGQADEGWNREVLGFYAPRFAHCQQVLDVGCGDGQFMELLRADGVGAVGIDVDTRMIERCRQKGLPAIEANLFDYLPQQKERFDGIFSSNVIEHLSMRDALRFLKMALEALRPGGLLLLATPNPESLIVHLYEFWRDATHVRLYSRFLLDFLVSWAGFEGVESGENPRTAWTPPPALQALPERLESLLTRQGLMRASIQGTFAPVMEPQVGQRERPLWQRVALSVRRRLARFLTKTVLFEEFHAIETDLSAMHKALEAESATLETTATTVQYLYQSHSSPLVVPREIFVKGVRPSVGPEESR